MPWISWIQGEADQAFGTTRATYRARFLQLMADCTADIMAITGQATPPKWMVNQTASWEYYSSVASIGLELLAIARDTAGVWVVGGQYQLPYADGLHLNRIGYYRVGELIGRAINAVNATGDWTPFAPRSVVGTETGIDVEFDVPVAPLTIDTTLIPAQTDFGFSLHGTAAQITAVTLTGYETVRIDTDQPVTETGATLGYGVSANDGDVGWGNLRDAEPALSGYDSAPIADWMLHSRDPVTPFGIPGSIIRVTQWRYVSPSGLVPIDFVPANP